MLIFTCVAPTFRRYRMWEYANQSTVILWAGPFAVVLLAAGLTSAWYCLFRVWEAPECNVKVAQNTVQALELGLIIASLLWVAMIIAYIKTLYLIVKNRHTPLATSADSVSE